MPADASGTLPIMVPPDRDLAGRSIVITGANTGIGRATAVDLARRGATLVLACCSEDRTRGVLAEIAGAGGDAAFLSLDLTSFASVREAAKRILDMNRPLDVLLNNAGVAPARGGLTKDGFELGFGTNHLGHFLLTMLLAPKLIATPRARIVNVASEAHRAAKGIDYDAVRRPTRTVVGVHEYEISKLANILFTRAMARRIGPLGVHSYALHPGVVASDAWRRIPWPIRPLMKLRMISNEEGSKTSIYCATSPDVAKDDGRYYDACKERAPSELAQRDDLAEELWDKSVQFTGADLERRTN
jgi:NAD(P)-dependent dehydrogenase (short-subunit alcohol dehydrogenase family)